MIGKYLLLSILAFTAALTSGAPEAPKVKVTFTSECTCTKCHQEWRKAVKTETDDPPSIPADHKITPATMAKWAGPGGTFHKDTDRSGKELEWFSMTGKVTHIKVEADGDVHMQLVGKTASSSAVQVLVEVPLGKKWCGVRQDVFSLTTAKFPLTPFESGKDLTLTGSPVVTVTGKAFYDAEHDGGDSNSNLRDVAGGKGAVWEIHPVMGMKIISK